MAEWTKQDISGHNQKLVDVAEKITRMTRVAITEKIVGLKAYAQAEAKKHDSPELDTLLEYISKLEKQYKL